MEHAPKSGQRAPLGDPVRSQFPTTPRGVLLLFITTAFVRTSWFVHENLNHVHTRTGTSFWGCYLRIPTPCTPPIFLLMIFMAGDNLYIFFLFAFSFYSNWKKAPVPGWLFVMSDAHGRLSDHLLARASEGPRSKRRMSHPAPVIDRSCANFTPSRKSVTKARAQLDRLRNHAASPAWGFSPQCITPRQGFAFTYPLAWHLGVEPLGSRPREGQKTAEQIPSL